MNEQEFKTFLSNLLRIQVWITVRIKRIRRRRTMTATRKEGTDHTQMAGGSSEFLQLRQTTKKGALKRKTKGNIEQINRYAMLEEEEREMDNNKEENTGKKKTEAMEISKKPKIASIVIR